MFRHCGQVPMPGLLLAVTGAICFVGCQTPIGVPFVIGSLVLLTPPVSNSRSESLPLVFSVGFALIF